MFLLNSCFEPFLCGQFSLAPLLPKLRGHFAEFLDNASSVGLRILSSSTCVGLRYGYSMNNSGFSRRMAHILPYFCSVRITSSDCLADLPTRLLPRLPAAFHSAAMLSTRVPTVLSYCSTGISTCCPSATSFDLALGPDLPRAVRFPWKPRYWPRGFPPLSRYSFRHSLFHKVHSSLRYCFFPYAMLLYQSLCDSSASVSCFSPDIFGAGPLDQ